jgi:hypothetical protein
MISLLAFILDGPTPDQLENLIPIFGILAGIVITVAIVIGIAYIVVRKKEAERDMFARRLAYEQRMKELEVEALRLKSGVEGTGVAR